MVTEAALEAPEAPLKERWERWGQQESTSTLLAPALEEGAVPEAVVALTTATVPGT